MVGDTSRCIFAKGIAWRCKADQRPRRGVMKGVGYLVWVDGHNENIMATSESCQAPLLFAIPSKGG